MRTVKRIGGMWIVNNGKSVVQHNNLYWALYFAGLLIYE